MARTSDVKLRASTPRLTEDDPSEDLIHRRQACFGAQATRRSECDEKASDDHGTLTSCSVCNHC